MYKFKPVLFLFFISLVNLTASAQNFIQTDSTFDAHHTSISDTLTIPYRYQDIHRRSPVLAGALAILVPTAGQFYNKQYLKAGAILAVATVTSIGAVVSYMNSHPARRDGTTNFYLTLLTADVVYAIVDAPLSSIYLNKKYHLGNKREFSSLHFTPGLLSENAGGNRYAMGFGLVLK